MLLPIAKDRGRGMKQIKTSLINNLKRQVMELRAQLSTKTSQLEQISKHWKTTKINELEIEC